MKKLIAILLLLFIAAGVNAQTFDSTSFISINYQKPKEYRLAGIAVKGNQYTDRNIIILMSGLRIGQKITIPGSELRDATQNLWDQGLFSNIEFRLAGTNGNNIFLNLVVQERPRLSKSSIKGLKKNQQSEIKDLIDLHRNQIITEDLINQIDKKIDNYFYEKGYFGIESEFILEDDTSKPNFKILRIDINKGNKFKVQDVIFEGNENLADKKLRKLLKPKRLKQKINIFASSKYVATVYEESRPAIIAEYNELGFRDASLEYDSIIRVSDKRVIIKIKVNEGKKYYFRDITWVGNTKHRTSLLDSILNIKSGDVYDQTKLNERLNMNPAGFDVSSLYMDDGYLFFNIAPVEVLVEGDSIDIEIRIYEGKQATVNRVTVVGNDKTSDFVALRVIRTMPGDKFSRSDIQRSMRELASLGFFDPESLDVKPKPNPADGTVDIEYVVAEKPSDQIEASGGWGGPSRFIGSVGLTLNNFSTRKMTSWSNWNPIPSGDGQRVSLRLQSNSWYQNYSFNFVEPWLGGKKPNSLSVQIYHSVQSNGFSFNQDRPTFKTTGAIVAFGKRLKFPDDYFYFNTSLSYQRYALNDWSFNGQELGFSNGFANNLSVTAGLTRNSTNQPIYPSSGSIFNASFQFTPPYSLFAPDRDYSNLTSQERFKWIELHKTKFEAQWFIGFGSKKRPFVIAPAVRFGAVGIYNSELGYSPFEQFKVGGSGLTGFMLYGTDIVSQRGYEDGSITDPSGANQAVMPIYTKYTLEFRYPLTTGQSSTIYLQGFIEAGNAYRNFDEFDPFNVRRAAGGGVRLFLPMFGLLGLDYAWPLDPGGQGIPHFFIGQQF